MKKFYYGWLMLMMGILFIPVGCNDDDKTPGEVLTLDLETVNLKAEGETVRVGVTSSVENWTAEVSGGIWCTAVREGNEVVISAGSNSLAEPQETKVLIKAGTQEKSIKVVQSASVLVEGLNINIPADFKQGLVLKVLEGSREVAQICNEYIPAADAANRLTVVYILNAEGKPDLSCGFVCENGGEVAWNIENNTCQYTAGTLATPVKRICLLNGKIDATAIANKEATVVPDKLKDIENNEYQVVKIGTQYWMAENLRTTKYRDGSVIPNGQENWPQTVPVDEENEEPVTTAAWSVAYNWQTPGELIPAEIRSYYGFLYNWVALYGENVSGTGTEKLAPEGWHIPDSVEWHKLQTYLNAENAAACVLAQGSDMPEALAMNWNWMYPGSNLSGFTAFPAGNRIGDNTFNITMRAMWWMGDSKNLFIAPYIEATVLSPDIQSMVVQSGDKSWGCSVRCIKD